MIPPGQEATRLGFGDSKSRCYGVYLEPGGPSFCFFLGFGHKKQRLQKEEALPRTNRLEFVLGVYLAHLTLGRKKDQFYIYIRNRVPQKHKVHHCKLAEFLV